MLIKIYRLILKLCLIAFFASCSTIQNAQDILNYKITLASSEQNDTTTTSIESKVDNQGRKASLLVAFFGLDNGLPKIANKGVCPGAGGKDGMPVIFSHEIDVSTMQAGDFKVTLSSGKIGEVTCATLAPADDKGELRTALLAGEFGDSKDQPVKVEIVGNILSIDGSLNFKGESIAATTLESGPTIIFAESIPQDQWELGKKGTSLRWGGGTGCPVGTKNIVGVTWVGGVTKPGGGEVTDKERQQYKISVKQLDDKMIEVIPFAIADLNDGDNNHKLCLDVEGIPNSVFFPAGFLADPRGDLNPDTKIQIIEN